MLVALLFGSLFFLIALLVIATAIYILELTRGSD